MSLRVSSVTRIRNAVTGITTSFRERGLVKTIEKYRGIIGIELSKKRAEKYRGSCRDHEIYRVGICVSGGIGDAVICMNYSALLKKHLGGDAEILFYFQTHRRIYEFLGENRIGISKQYFDKTDDLDVLLSLDTYIPRVIYSNEKINLDSNLCRYVGALSKFYEKNPQLYEKDIYICHKNTENYMLDNHIKRYEVADVDGRLGIDHLFEFSLLDRIEKCQPIVSGDYITVHRGCDLYNRSRESTKMWPITHYERLLHLIKEKYPSIRIIQIGIEDEKQITGTDFSLVGKTNLNQVAYILSKSLLHIDVEGGCVHIRHAVSGKPSIVLFGSTTPEVYGYPENINIRRGDICPRGCIWSNSEWNEKCSLPDADHKCMNDLMPESVFESIINLLNSMEN